MSKILNLQRLVLAIATFAVIALGSATASADSVSFSTAPGATAGGQPVSATATFTVSATGILTITLTNTLVNPTSVAQNISDLSFHIAGFSGTLSSSNCNTIFVNSDKTTSPGDTNVSTQWILDSSGPNFHLNGLGTDADNASKTIIGAPGPGGLYSNANGGIAGNTGHNPFIDQTATFTLSIPGLTSATLIDGVVFSFGTTAGSNVPGVPEPATMLLLGTGLLGVAGVVRRFRKS